MSGPLITWDPLQWDTGPPNHCVPPLGPLPGHPRILQGALLRQVRGHHGGTRSGQGLGGQLPQLQVSYTLFKLWFSHLVVSYWQDDYQIRSDYRNIPMLLVRSTDGDIWWRHLRSSFSQTSDLELELGWLFGIAPIYSIAVSTFPDTILQLVTPRT